LASARTSPVRPAIVPFSAGAEIAPGGPGTGRAGHGRSRARYRAAQGGGGRLSSRGIAYGLVACIFQQARVVCRVVRGRLFTYRHEVSFVEATLYRWHGELPPAQHSPSCKCRAAEHAERLATSQSALHETLRPTANEPRTRAKQRDQGQQNNNGRNTEVSRLPRPIVTLSNCPISRMTTRSGTEAEAKALRSSDFCCSFGCPVRCRVTGGRCGGAVHRIWPLLKSMCRRRRCFQAIWRGSPSRLARRAGHDQRHHPRLS
jgi:hypothetical protein